MKKNMKKILLSFLTVFIFIGSLTIVNATTTAKAPETFPDENDTVQAVLDEQFDFSKISFTSSDGTSTIPGHNYMRKIMITLTPDANGATIADKLGESWFTVYCLDGGLKFPLYSYTNFTFGQNIPDDVKLQQVIMFRLFNDGKYRNAFAKAKGMIIDPQISYELESGQTATSVLSALDAGNEVTLIVKNVQYIDVLASKTVTISPADLTGNASDTALTLALRKSNMMFDNYYAKTMDDTDYNHALWIIEHSYPTHDLRTSLMLADASYTNLLAEIKALYPSETKTDEEWEKLLEDYVYSTVQYAIWYVNNGIDVNGNKLGKELKGSSELNKLYQYLIKDRNEYEGYSDYQFSNTIGLNKPDPKKEIFSETKEHYVYGPYSIKHNLISLDRVDISIKDIDKNAGGIVDEAGNALTTINPNQNFYIKVAKNAKVANLEVNLATQNALTFFPSTDRGKIYSPYYPLVQNVVSGGKIVSTNITKTVDIVFNPKTGAEDIAILFVISLVAFSLGYLVLVFKNKPVRF